MTKFCLFVALSCAVTLTASAQSTPSGELFAGAQIVHAGGATAAGFIGDGTIDFGAHLGATVQFNAVGAFGGAGAGYAALGGLSIFPAGHRRIAPFVRLLGGGAWASSGSSVSPGYFAASLGGGGEFAVTDRIGIRAGADWLHVPAFGASAARAYVGLAVHF